MCVSLLLIRVLQPGDRHALRGPWRYKDSVNLPLRGHSGGTVSSEQKVKVSIGTELPASICYAHSPKHLELGDGVALQVG